MSDESAVREVISRIDAAWRSKRFAGLEECFHPDAMILGPGGIECARGREKCAESYREFAANAAVLAYRESAHSLRLWEHIAVYTFDWEMTYQRDLGPRHENGTDLLVFQLGKEGWQLVWRRIECAPV